MLSRLVHKDQKPLMKNQNAKKIIKTAKTKKTSRGMPMGWGGGLKCLTDGWRKKDHIVYNNWCCDHGLLYVCVSSIY